LPGEEVSDGQLLERFVHRRDDRAFAALLDRHGPLVLGVCRRVLRHAQDAEDAFQATFLILARRAASIRRPGAVASWLYEVAYRVALKARAAVGRQRLLKKQVENMAHTDPLAAAASGELRAIVDEELSRLPEKYRAPLVLCYLQGHSNEEAGRRLGWTKGTVSGRLARARALLRGRLARRGLAVPAGLLVPALAQSAAGAAVPAALAAATTRAALLFGAGGATAGLVSAPVATLTEGALKAMFLTKLKLAAVLALLLSCVGVGAGVWTRPTLAAPGSADRRAAKPRAGAPMRRLMLAPLNPPMKTPFRQALDAAHAIPDANLKVSVLQQIAVAQAEAGDRKGAGKTFEAARQAAHTIPGDGKAFVLVFNGLLQTQCGDQRAAQKSFQQGVAAAKAIKDTEARLGSLLNIGLRLAEAKDRAAARKAFQLARAAADTVANETDKEYRISWVASFQANAGLVKEALKTAADLSEENARRWAYRDIAMAQARAGDVKTALQTAQKVSRLGDVQNECTDQVLAGIATAQAETGDLKGALETAAAMTNDWWKAVAYAGIAEAQAKAKDRRAALKTLELALASAHRIERGTRKEQQLQHIASAQVKVGDLKGARQTARAIADDSFKALVLGTIAAAQAKGKDFKAARRTIRETLQTLERVKIAEGAGYSTAVGNHWFAREEVVKAHLQAKDFKAALETARGLKYEAGQIQLFHRIARAQAAAGQEHEALTWAAKLKPPYARAMALLGVAAGSSSGAGAK
jgi:RNA polymerase sigma factor (sigma-70 family)